MYVPPAEVPLDGHFTEKIWSNPVGDHIAAYAKSKTLAEQAAWDFQKALPIEEQFEIATINPGFIVGPSFIGPGFSSGEAISIIMNSVYPGVPKIMMPTVDVRETAQAHLEALRRPEAANQRFILSNETIWFQRVAQVLQEEFQPQGYNITTKELQRCLLTIGSWFKPEIKQVIHQWGQVMNFDNTKSREILGIKYCDINKSLVEMTYSMFETGALQDKRTKPKL